jgi:hypothetical protein
MVEEVVKGSHVNIDQSASFWGRQTWGKGGGVTEGWKNYSQGCDGGRRRTHQHAAATKATDDYD